MSRPTSTRSHLSIGEVLSLLRTQFPDVTISKIRFLESQGLLDPERTPSGYRKFYDADIKRLRWILYQQKEHYLPLKVIKERLDEAGRELPSDDDSARDARKHSEADGTGQQRLLADDVERRAASSQQASSQQARSAGRESPPGDDAPPMGQHNGHMGNGAAGHQSTPQLALQHPRVGHTNRTPARAHREAPSASFAADHPAGHDPAGTAPERSAPAPADSSVDDPSVNELNADELNVDELADASGLLVRDIRQLERFGLIEPRDVGGENVYDGDALTVARVAASFMRHGIEARHMRTYRVVVDREASLFEQIVLPVLKRRNPEARKRAAGTVAELIQLGDTLRAILLQHELRDYLNGGD